MKTPTFSSIAACTAVFGLLLSYGNTQADPLTPTAKVTVTTLVRAEGTPQKVLKLARNEVFILSGYSRRLGDSVDVIFAKGGDSFRTAITSPFSTPVIDLQQQSAIPLKGPATGHNLREGTRCI
ncbi:MAG: hypothetical protein H0W34_06850 [Pyrinomonadaceae bacterium]|nr:hypothetical protein [Pyrinomonadaceae bacterium]